MMTSEEIARLAEIMSEHDLTEISLQTDALQVKLLRGGKEIISLAGSAAGTIAMNPQTAVQATLAEGATVAESAEPALSINSPIVGTFYSAPAPDANSFVSVGDRVSPDTVVCIVEAMKVMNEIKAEMTGIIKKALVDNASPVEFGQPLFEIEAD